MLACKSILRALNRNAGRILALAGILACIGSPFAALADRRPDDKSKSQTGPVLTEDNEVRLGRDNAEENDKHVKLVTDAAIVDRVNRIGRELAAVANRVPIQAQWGSSQLKQFDYTFRVVDDKDVNAYSLPGGFIYINKGLIDYVHSDDELAGVIAHEITHASHHHMVKLMREQGKIQNILIPALLVMAAAGRGGAAGNLGTLMMGGQLYMTAKLNTYGVEAEKDADHGGLLLMTHTKYNPAGLYSFMTRLAADELRKGPQEMGIFRTHPPGPERVEAARKLLISLRIPIELSKVDPNQRVTVVLIKGGLAGRDVAELRIMGMALCKVVAADDLSAQERGEKIAAKLSPMFDGSRPVLNFEVKVVGSRCVMVRDLVVQTEEDARAQGKTIAELGKGVATTISQVSSNRQSEMIPHD
ncbi:MAG TPA: M48 family metalloprotease [Chthonomonadaceae bacterium]|nr:M48 family metalloprotease [Chthonomonadaceae bacterium]